MSKSPISSQLHSLSPFDCDTHLGGQHLLAAVTLCIRHDGRSIRQLWGIAVEDNAIAVHGHGSQLASRRKRNHIAPVIVVRPWQVIAEKQSQMKLQLAVI